MSLETVQTIPDMRPAKCMGLALLRAVSLLFPGVAVALLVLAVGDIFRIAPEAHRFLRGPLDAGALALQMAGLYLWSGLWVVVPGGVLLSIASSGEPEALLDSARRRMIDLVRTGTGEPGRGARLMSWTLCAGFFFLVTWKVVLVLAGSVNTANLMALAVAATVIVAVPVTGLLFAISTAILTKAGGLPGIGRLVHARTVLGAWALVLLAAMVFAVVREREIFKSLDGWALYMPVVALAAGTVAVLFQPTWLTGFMRPRLSVGLGITAFVAVVLMVGGIFFAGSNLSARALLFTWGRDGAVIARFWERAFDFNGDGESVFLGDPGPKDVEIKVKASPLQRPKLTHPLSDVKNPDIVMISIDGCRRDALGVYGARPNRSPNIDKFAISAVVFDDVVAPATWTMASFVSILTGRQASEIPGFYGASQQKAVPKNLRLLQEPFQTAGYHTVAVTAGLRLDGLGLKRGFTKWHSITPQARGSFAVQVADKAVDVLKTAPEDKPLFMWVHFIDPHYPYKAPKKNQLFGSDRPGQYAAEIHFVDAAVARILEALKAGGRSENTIVVVFSDHGEAFREHGTEYHGITTYAEEVRVPLMMRVPGVAPHRVPDLTGMIDLAPTLWDLAGLSNPPPVRGVSVAPLLVNKTPSGRQSVYTEHTRKTREYALTTAGYRLRYVQSLKRYELYDRVADPTEQNDISAERPDVVLKMRRELARSMANIVKPK